MKRGVREVMYKDLIRRNCYLQNEVDRLEAVVAELRRVLGMVEFVAPDSYGFCPWCGASNVTLTHEDDCPRETALAPRGDQR